MDLPVHHLLTVGGIFQNLFRTHRTMVCFSGCLGCFCPFFLPAVVSCKANECCCAGWCYPVALRAAIRERYNIQVSALCQDSYTCLGVFLYASLCACHSVCVCALLYVCLCVVICVRFCVVLRPVLRPHTRVFASLCTCYLRLVWCRAFFK